MAIEGAARATHDDAPIDEIRVRRTRRQGWPRRRAHQQKTSQDYRHYSFHNCSPLCRYASYSALLPMSTSPHAQQHTQSQSFLPVTLSVVHQL